MKPVNNIRIFRWAALASVFLLLPGAFSRAGDDGVELLRAVINKSAAVRAIDAEITQYIDTEGKPREVFRGRYRADRQGRFRIDYTVPSKQTVLNDGRGFYWYYHEDRLLYRMAKTADGPTSPAFNPVKELEGGMEGDRFTVLDLGPRLYGFFGMGRHLAVTDREKALRVDMLVDPGKKVVLKKTVRGRTGMELMKERYEHYRTVSGCFFPGRVTVTVRTGRGITRNITEYGAIKLNSAVTPAVFRLELPPDVTVKDMP